MPITSSTFTKDPHTQKDGRRYVYEKHTANTGQVFDVAYLAAGDALDATLTATMNARAAQYNTTLADTEFGVIVDGS